MRSLEAWCSTRKFAPSTCAAGVRVQAPSRAAVALFPAWDRSQDASFADLLVKGALEVSAAWAAADQTVHNLSLVARPAHRGPVVLTGPLPRGPLAVACADGSAPPVQRPDAQTISFVAPPGVRCSVVCDGAAH